MSSLYYFSIFTFLSIIPSPLFHFISYESEYESKVPFVAYLKNAGPCAPFCLLVNSSQTQTRYAGGRQEAVTTRCGKIDMVHAISYDSPIMYSLTISHPIPLPIKTHHNPHTHQSTIFTQTTKQSNPHPHPIGRARGGRTRRDGMGSWKCNKVE